MRYNAGRLMLSLTLGAMLLPLASATSISRLSFEELTDSSDIVASGKINRSWAAWDENQKYIWTHYELAVSSTHKGSAGPVVEFAEPGGTVAPVVMAIAGSVIYTTGENVIVFLQKMPNGYLRTTGWGQGKYNVDSAGRLHNGVALRGIDVVDQKTGIAAGSSLRTLEGMSISDLGAHIAARTRLAVAQGSTK